jgi:hypothetical protein
MRTRDKERLARHIVATYEAATPAERLEGRSWYSVARDAAVELDPNDPVRAAAVIAVLSPRVNWERNVKLAADAYAGRPLACIKRNAEKANAIVGGSDPEEIVSGDKVRAFWRAIVDPTDARAIVIDRHAIDVAFGEVMDDERRGKILGKRGAYGELADRYVYATEVINQRFGVDLTPVQVQATTWVAWRRMKKGHGL